MSFDGDLDSYKTTRDHAQVTKHNAYKRDGDTMPEWVVGIFSQAMTALFLKCVLLILRIVYATITLATSFAALKLSAAVAYFSFSIQHRYGTKAFLVITVGAHGVMFGEMCCNALLLIPKRGKRNEVPLNMAIFSYYTKIIRDSTKSFFQFEVYKVAVLRLRCAVP